MEINIKKKYLIIFLFFFILNEFIALKLLNLPFIIITLEGNVESSSHFEFISIVKHIFGNGNEIIHYYSSNPQYIPIIQWELSFDINLLSILYYIYLGCVVFSPTWHIIPKRKYRIIAAVSIMLFENSILILWLFNIIFPLSIENAKLFERFSSTSENLIYSIDFTLPIIFILLFSGIILFDLTLNNKSIIQEIKRKVDLKFENVIDENIEFEDSQYEIVKTEINQSYNNFLFTSMYILLRKLLENLVYDSLKNFYNDNDTNKYFDTNHNRHHNFSTLIENFNEMIDNPKFRAKIGDIEQGFIDILKQFQEKGNKNVHSLFNIPHQSFIEDNKEILNILINSLLNIEKKLRN